MDYRGSLAALVEYEDRLICMRRELARVRSAGKCLAHSMINYLKNPGNPDGVYRAIQSWIRCQPQTMREDAHHELDALLEELRSGDVYKQTMREEIDARIKQCIASLMTLGIPHDEAERMVNAGLGPTDTAPTGEGA